MLVFIYDWIKQIAVCMILITIVLQLLPDNSYKNYVKFYCGLLLILQLIGPILNLFGRGFS